MTQTAKHYIGKHEPGQSEHRGYIISEDADFALKDIANGLDAIATLCEEREGDVPEMSPQMWGGLLRTFSRQAKAIYEGSAFANRALARPRDMH